VLWLRAGEGDILDETVEEDGLGVEGVRMKDRLYFQTGGWRGSDDLEGFEKILGMVGYGDEEKLMVKFFEW